MVEGQLAFCANIGPGHQVQDRLVKIRVKIEYLGGAETKGGPLPSGRRGVRRGSKGGGVRRAVACRKTWRRR